MGNDLVVFNDKVIVVGVSYESFGSQIFILQYTAIGELDPTFSGDGKVKTSLGFEEPVLEGVIIRDGKIIAVGQTNDLSILSIPLSDALMVRYDAAGKLDTTFGVNGIVTTTWPKPAVYKSIAVKGARIYTVGFYFEGYLRDRLILAAYKP